VTDLISLLLRAALTYRVLYFSQCWLIILQLFIYISLPNALSRKASVLLLGSITIWDWRISFQLKGKGKVVPVLN